MLSNKLNIPYSNHQLENDPRGIKRMFNKIQSSARMVTERGIGKLKQRLKKLMSVLTIFEAGNSIKFIISASIFHQLLLNIEDGYNENESEDCDSEEVNENFPIEDRNTFRDMIAERFYIKHRWSFTIYH